MLCAVAIGALVGFPAAPAGADVRVATADPGPVIVVGVAGLRWSDVSVTGTPVLASIVDGAAVGALSVRSAPAPPDVTCPGEGWLTLGAGGYAAIGGSAAAGCVRRMAPPVEVADHESSDGVPDGVSARVPDLPALYAVNAGLRFGARPGTLGDAVPCAVAVGSGAALAVADRHGMVDRYVPSLPDRPGRLFEGCPLTVVDLGSLPAGSGGRRQGLAAVERALGTIEASRPPGSTLLVLGVAGSVGDPAPRLHLAALTGPGVEPGWLVSPSTRRAPYLQLSDVAPTVLTLIGADLPAGLAGQPVRGGGPGRPDGVEATAAALVDLDRAAAAQRAAVTPFFAWYGALLLLMLGLYALIRRRGGAPGAAAGGAALLLAAVPAGTFLANLVPWWRAPYPPFAAWVATLVAAGVIAGVALAASTLGRRPARPGGAAASGPGGAVRPGRAALVVAVVTAGVLAWDAVTGATLQINSMLGYNPLVAGRFVGFGNLAFAVFATAALLAAGAAAGGLRRARPRAGIALVTTAGVVALTVDGAPAWGADFGGVLTLAPAFVVLGLLTAGAALRPGRLLVAGAAGVLTAVGIGLLDARRPVEQRSHFGRFVAGIGDGSAVATVQRKLDANLDLLFSGPHTIAALVLTGAASVWLLRTPAPLAALYVREPWLRPALVSAVAMAWIAFATNDSGVAIPIVAMLVAGPTVLAVHTLNRPGRA
ncbi:hypothetical protein Vau01_082770 [Virgisporangium aurantiacum]|uniref:Uncharacterized protein n=1 Tax=Virgisporangium aurantiacum TaxID=175570 RepID=A0A8J4E433_9ACTN|nr:hypothetical protein Vau01_082770 [Virgisporangium aurantiacum]